MSVWQVSDKTRVEQAGQKLVVQGTSPFANYLRGELKNLEWNVPVFVPVGPPPGAGPDLDPTDTWLVDHWIRHHAFRLGELDVTSDYVAKDADMPELAREIMSWRESDDPPGTIY